MRYQACLKKIISSLLLCLIFYWVVGIPQYHEDRQVISNDAISEKGVSFEICHAGFDRTIHRNKTNCIFKNVLTAAFVTVFFPYLELKIAVDFVCKRCTEHWRIIRYIQKKDGKKRVSNILKH